MDSEKALTAVRDLDEDAILVELEETIKKYRETRDKSLGPHLRQLVSILVIKMILAKKGDDVAAVLQDMELTQKGLQFMKPNKN